MRNRTTHATLALCLVAACAHPGASPESSTIDLVVAATTDVHGRLRGWNYESNRPDTLRGLTRASTIVDSVRRSAPGRGILLDAGDLLQGNSLTYVAARIAPEAPHPVMAAMSAMQYDAAAVGNHEFNYGLPFFDRALAEAPFPFLAANAYRADGTRPFRSWVRVERVEAPIAFLGPT